MTAYGRAKRETSERSVLVEIRSVNNRYLDCTIKIPRLFGFLEDKVAPDGARHFKRKD